MGIQIFHNIQDAIRAGFMITSPIADVNGFLHARIHTSAGWAEALVEPNGGLF